MIRSTSKQPITPLLRKHDNWGMWMGAKKHMMPKAFVGYRINQAPLLHKHGSHSLGCSSECCQIPELIAKPLIPISIPAQIYIPVTWYGKHTPRAGNTINNVRGPWVDQSQIPVHSQVSPYSSSLGLGSPSRYPPKSTYPCDLKRIALCWQDINIRSRSLGNSVLSQGALFLFKSETLSIF